MHIRLVATAAVVAASLPTASPAQNQDLVEILRDDFRENAARADLGNAFQALSTFGSVPGISAASYNVDGGEDGDLDLNSFKLSPSHTFDPIFGVKPYVEGTFGYLDTKQTLTFDTGDVADVDIKTFSFLGGIGAEFDLAEGTVIRPMLLAGYSRTTDSADFRGPLAEEIEAAGDGIVFDVAINSFLVGGAVALEHDRRFDGDINLNARLRYNHLFERVLSASDPVLETDGDFGVLTSGVEVDGPLGVSVFGRELRWIGFAANTYLPGEQNDALGFSYFFEFGAGLELVDRTVVSGIEGISLRGSGIVGDNVTGWTAGLSIEF